MRWKNKHPHTMLRESVRANCILVTKNSEKIFEVSQYLSKCLLCLDACVKTFPLTVHLQGGIRIKVD